MSGQRFRAREKTVQKMGRDGLVEQNLATGQQQRISRRAADISFQAERPEKQAAGHRAAQRMESAESGAEKKRRKQPRPTGQTAQEAAYTQTPDLPQPEQIPAALPSMRGAADMPMLDMPPIIEEVPPPKRKRRGKGKDKKAKQRQAARLSPDAARPVDSLQAKAALDTPARERARRPAEGGGQLQFESQREVINPAPDTGQAGKNKRAAQRRRQTEWAVQKPSEAEMADTQTGRASSPEADGGRPHFESQREAITPAPDTGQAGKNKKTAQRRQQKKRATLEASKAEMTDTQPGQAGNPEADSGRLHFESFGPDMGKPEATKRASKSKKHRQTALDSASQEKPRLRFEDEPSGPGTASVSSAEGKPPDSPSTRLDKKVAQAARRAERAGRRVERAREQLPVTHRLSIKKEWDGEAGRPRRRLHFEQEVKPEYIKPSLPAQAGRMVETAAIMKLHGKLREVERQNVAVEAVHKGEIAAEQGAGRFLRWNRRRLRAKPYRALRHAERQAVKENARLQWQTALRDHPELRQKNALARWVQKQKIKRRYAQAARKAKQTAQFTRQAAATGKVVRAIAQYAAAHKTVLAAVALLAVVILFFSAGFASCTAMLSGIQSSYISASYMADEQEIGNASLLYTELETDLQLGINRTKQDYPGFDEYRFSIGEISHNPYELMGYLSTAFNAFTFSEVQAEIESLFAGQYALTRETLIETRYDDDGEPYRWYVLQTTLTVRPLGEIIAERLSPGEQADRFAVYMQTLGNRQAYGSPFTFPWPAHVSSGYGYRVHPITGEKNLHRGLDIAAAEGTPILAVQDGRVVSSGNAGDYGLCVLIEDERGYQSRYAHCSSLFVSAGQEVKRGEVIAAVGSTGQSTGSHLHLEVLLNGEYLNPWYFVDTGGDSYALPGTPGGPVIPENPGEPMGDGSFSAMLAEAERYLGLPYVWGGSTPSTSFDCSGYVSWVINQSGAGSVGRLTAQGLCNLCTSVSWEDLRPGDLVFFTGTYSSLTPVSHVGIYMGGGRMAHAGDPIGYANIGNSRYWKAHFYCGGRLP